MWDKDSCRSAVSQVLEWDFNKVHAIHGSFPIHDGKNALRQAFHFLWE